MTTAKIKRGLPPRVHTTMDLGDDHAIQILEFPSGMRAVIEGGRAVDHRPSSPGRVQEPPDAGEQSGGERSGDAGAAVRTTDEQVWFRETFCNGAQACVQAWDWAVVTSHAVRSGTGIGWVGSEGTRNATLAVDAYDCICVGPFCIGGTECFWVENWRGLIVPNHWLSATTTNSDPRSLRWRLEGAGGDTQVSLAAKY
ncbi:hypothetical protein, partial [Streptomyces sp. NPDC051183]|uniref:hypothetical protein n=1 Tax=unclassified Streptomyces TaxID=2593676 RepID=UPI00341C36D1